MATDDLAQLSTSMTRRRMRGPRWETFLLIEKIVCAICYQTERALLLEEQIAMAGLAEWTWHNCLTIVLHVVGKTSPLNVAFVFMVSSD